MRNWKAWLEDRGAHRGPVDDHFQQALKWCEEYTFRALELGPGGQDDLTLALQAANIEVTRADVDHHEGVTDISFDWETMGVLPWPENSFEAVLAREVMEHVADIFQMTREIYRVLRPGARFWFSTPFIFPLHDYDSGDYWRLSPKAWDWLLLQSGFRLMNVTAPNSRELWDSWQYPVTVLGWAQK